MRRLVRALDALAVLALSGALIGVHREESLLSALFVLLFVGLWQVATGLERRVDSWES